MKILFATTNKAKVKVYATRLKENGVDIVTLDDLNINADVDEFGTSPLENAIIKANAYSKMSNMPTIAMDDGLYLDNLPDSLQPGTNVRRVNGKRLDDKEMIEYYIKLVNEYGTNGELNGYLTKGVALSNNGKVQSIEIKFERHFTNQKSDIVNEGYPLSSIQFIKIYNKYKSELTREEEKETTDIEHKSVIDFILGAIEKIKE